MTQLQAVLWDMDGTLVDTEPYWIECEHTLVDRYGDGQWTHEMGLALVGRDLRDSARYLRQHAHVDLAVDDIVNHLLDGVIARVSEHVPWRPGARELLRALNDAGVPTALVTMSWRRLTDAVVAALPAGSFTIVVAGDDVTHGKPHPEPYLVAAERLRVDPTRCIAIEDSPTGVRSAVAAGCVVIGIPHVVPIPGGLGHLHRDTLEVLDVQNLQLLFPPCMREDRGA
jgi:beta-phosphoglucomutase-like phosphatase (HAD superfamily)